MATYKLKRVLYSPKKEKLRIQNGRSDITLDLNSGFINFRQMLNLISDQHNTQDEAKILIRAEYKNHCLSYFITTIVSNKEEISYPGSVWQKVDERGRSWGKEEVLFGSYHVNVADGANNNPIDDIVLSNKDKEFALEIELTKSPDEVSNAVLSKLSKAILVLSREKQLNQKKRVVDLKGSTQTKVFIDKEWLYNYLYDFYYYLNQSSNLFMFPIVRIYADNDDTLSCVKNMLISDSKKRGVNTNINYLIDNFKEHIPMEIDMAKLQESDIQLSISKWIEELPDHFIYSNNLFGVITNVNFVSALFAFSETRIPGIEYSEEINYGTVKDTVRNTNGYCLGLLYHNYQTLLPISIKFEDLIMHTLVTGVTGSGKTTSIKSMLYCMYESKIPFLILEPAKTEYKTLNIPNLKRYLLGIEATDCLKINPFEFPYKKEGTHGVHLQTHLDLLKSIFIAAFPMYGPMPYVLETAFYHIYQWYGWDFKSGHNIYWESTAAKSDLFPTLDDLYNSIDHIVSIQGYSKDLQNDLTAALKVRVGSLKSGAKGTMLNTNHGTGIGELLSHPTVIEIERIGDAQEKVFIMGLLLVTIYEHYIAQGQESEGRLKHLMVIEEAHRLLENVQQNNNNEIADMKGKALETFNNILSEIRAYGQGIIIADQIPTKISPDVIKNTNLKIVHRLFSLDDRNAIGDSIGLDHKQKKGLIHLKTGEAIVFHSGLQDAVKIKANSKGLERGHVPDTFISAELNTMDIVISTTRIYSELKKLFHTAIVLNWSHEQLTGRITGKLVRFGFEVTEHLAADLISNLVVWFSINLRNNMSISYNFLNELDIKKTALTPSTAIEEIRLYIKKHSPTIQYPVSLKSIYVEALDYFTYIFTEDRKDLSLRITAIQASHPDSFRFFNCEVQNLLLAESEMDRYLCLDLLSQEDKLVICQCLVYYCSYPHTNFQDYFNEPNAPVTDIIYHELLEESENQSVNTTKDQPQTDNIDISNLLKLIVENLQVIGHKQGFDSNSIGRLLRLPIAILLINSLMIVIAVLVIILR